MKILILGGTRFFGKKLVQLLIEDGHDVTIATRGNVQHTFDQKVNQVMLDRKNANALKEAVGDENWDIIYDNICYSPNEALSACEIFEGKTKKYILTSTLSTVDTYLNLIFLKRPLIHLIMKLDTEARMIFPMVKENVKQKQFSFKKQNSLL